MNRKLFSVVTVLLVLAVLIGVILIADFQPAEKEEFEVNVCLHLTDYNNQTMSYLRDLGTKCVRTDWVTNSTLMSAYSQDLENHGFKLLAILNMSTFPIRDSMLEEWNTTVTEIVNSPGFNNTDAVEICNEPNANAYFIPPETYYQMLKSAYAIIKNRTDIPVVFAGLSPDVNNYPWKTYLNAIFANNDAEGYFDYMGVHVYPSIADNVKALQFVEDLTTKAMWITEAGETSALYGEKAQAGYLKSIYSDLGLQVNKIFVYELKDKGISEESEDTFGLLRANGTKKEAYSTIKNINK